MAANLSCQFAANSRNFRAIANLWPPAMSPFDQFQCLLEPTSDLVWSRQVIQLAQALGFDASLLAIVPQPGGKLEDAYLRSNYASKWREYYDRETLAYKDPTVAHCIGRATALLWTPEIFVSKEQRAMYEEASSYGLRAGVTLPMHGAHGELGILCFVRDSAADEKFRREIQAILPELSLLRDIIFESGLDRAVQKAKKPDLQPLTKRERECLQWVAAGKTSWEIGLILNCAQSTVNFHLGNASIKLGVSTRREAVVRAIKLCMIEMP